MDKWNVLNPYTGLPFSNKKEWGIDECYNIDHPGKHYVKWKKPVTKDRYFIIPFIWNVQKRPIYIEKVADELDLGVRWAG